jgi:hypothetical protein
MNLLVILVDFSLTKGQLKEWKSKLEQKINWKKIAYHKLGLKDMIEYFFYKRVKNKNEKSNE